MEHPASRHLVSQRGATPHRAVAVVLVWNGRVALFRRSHAVAHDAGKWHCISGLVLPDGVPREQAGIELTEETGLTPDAIECLVTGPVLQIADEEDDRSTWMVHTFVARTTQRRLQLDWEHDSFRWVRPKAVVRFDGQVAWLSQVMDAVARHLPDQRR